MNTFAIPKSHLINNTREYSYCKAKCSRLGIHSSSAQQGRVKDGMHPIYNQCQMWIVELAGGVASMWESLGFQTDVLEQQRMMLLLTLSANTILPIIIIQAFR